MWVDEFRKISMCQYRWWIREYLFLKLLSQFSSEVKSLRPLKIKYFTELSGVLWPRMLLTEKATAPHSSTLAWRVPWTEEPGRLQSMGSLRVRYDWVTSLSLRYFRLLDFSHFVRQAYITIQFPLETVFTVPYRFWIILFPFLNFLFDFFHRPIGCLVAYCLASTHSCFFFQFFPAADF